MFNHLLTKPSVFKSVLPAIVVVTSLHTANALAETQANGQLATRSSSAASATASNNGQTDVHASNTTRTAASGNATLRVDEDAAVGAATNNAVKMKSAVKSTAGDTAADVKQSGRVITQQTLKAASSVSVQGDANALAGGDAVVETGDGIAINLNAVSDGQAGVSAQPGEVEGSGQTIVDSALNVSGNLRNNAEALIDVGGSSAEDLTGSISGAVDAGAELSADIESTTDAQQTVTSDIMSSVSDTANEARLSAEATAETAIEAATDVAAEVENESSMAAEETRQLSENIHSEVTGEFDAGGSTDIGL